MATRHFNGVLGYLYGPEDHFGRSLCDRDKLETLDKRRQALRFLVHLSLEYIYFAEMGICIECGLGQSVGHHAGTVTIDTFRLFARLLDLGDGGAGCARRTRVGPLSDPLLF